METCINYCEPGMAYMSSDERRWINRLHKYNVEHPDECIIMKQPEDNDGFIYAKFPTSWIKLGPKRKVSDEMRAKATERFAKYRTEKDMSSTNGLQREK